MKNGVSYNSVVSNESALSVFNDNYQTECSLTTVVKENFLLFRLREISSTVFAYMF